MVRDILRSLGTPKVEALSAWSGPDLPALDL